MEFIYEFLGLGMIALPLLLSLISFLAFALDDEIGWSATGPRKIWRYILLAILVFMNVYFAYGILFTDPELLLIYPIWSGPAGLSLIGVSLISWKKGSRADKLFGIFGIILAAASLLVPFIVII